MRVQRFRVQGLKQGSVIGPLESGVDCRPVIVGLHLQAHIPDPHTLHLQAPTSILNPPEPKLSHPKPHTLNPKAHTTNSQPYTPNPKPGSPSACLARLRACPSGCWRPSVGGVFLHSRGSSVHTQPPTRAAGDCFRTQELGALPERWRVLPHPSYNPTRFVHSCYRPRMVFPIPDIDLESFLSLLSCTSNRFLHHRYGP